GNFRPLTTALPYHRTRNAVTGMDVVECISALHAQVPVAYGCIHYRPHGNQMAARHTRLHLTTRATVGASRAGPRRWYGATKCVFVLQCACGASIHACAAGDTTALSKRYIVIGDNSGSLSSIPDIPYELALQFGADPHAPIAVDTPRHLHLNVRVGSIDKSAFRHLALKAVMPEPAMKRLFRPQSNGGLRIPFRKHRQGRFPARLQFRSVSPHLHPVRGNGRACG